MRPIPPRPVPVATLQLEVNAETLADADGQATVLVADFTQGQDLHRVWERHAAYLGPDAGRLATPTGWTVTYVVRLYRPR